MEKKKEMEIRDIYFKEDDIKTGREFGAFLTQKAKLDMTIPESIRLTQLLGWYNGMIGKIEAHVFELKKVHKPDGTTEEGSDLEGI